MASFDQSSFAGGQVSRKYFGQEKEGQEDRLAMAKNVIVDSEGSVEKRPGTQVILKDNVPWSVSGDKKVKLVPFRYSNSDQYVLILKDYKMDILQGQSDNRRGCRNTVVGGRSQLRSCKRRTARTQILSGRSVARLHPSKLPSETAEQILGLRLQIRICQ